MHQVPYPTGLKIIDAVCFALIVLPQYPLFRWLLRKP